MAWMNAIPENKLPYIDTINLVYIADSSQILTQAQAGQLDWFGENGKDVLSLDQISQLTAADVGTVYPFTSGSPSAIALKVGQEPFSDIRVRQAMQLAIDLEAINTFLGNTGEVVVPGLWSTALSWSTVDEWPDDLKAQFTTKTADLAANQEKARQLLADAGYADGFTFEVELDPTTNLELFQVAASYLQQIGITMEISVAAEMMEAVQHSQDYTDPRQSAGFGGGFGEYNLAFMMTGQRRHAQCLRPRRRRVSGEARCHGQGHLRRGAGQPGRRAGPVFPCPALGHPGGRCAAQL